MGKGKDLRCAIRVPHLYRSTTHFPVVILSEGRDPRCPQAKILVRNAETNPILPIAQTWQALWGHTHDASVRMK